TATGTTDDGTLSVSPLVVNVNNIPPALSISGAASVNEGSVYTLTLSGTPDSVDGDPITGWTITWGDGATQALSGNPTSVTHTYLDGPNSYNISASAADKDGYNGANTVAVTVNNVNPSFTANN